MSLPERETYGGSTETTAHAEQIKVTEDLTIWFSFQRPIGFQFGESDGVVCDGDWSKVTKRHLNCLCAILPLARHVSPRSFERLWNNGIAKPLAKLAKAKGPMSG